MKLNISTYIKKKILLANKNYGKYYLTRKIAFKYNQIDSYLPRETLFA